MHAIMSLLVHAIIIVWLFREYKISRISKMCQNKIPHDFSFVMEWHGDTHIQTLDVYTEMAECICSSYGLMFRSLQECPSQCIYVHVEWSVDKFSQVKNWHLMAIYLKI